MSDIKETRFGHAPHRWRGVRPWQRHSLVLLVAGLVYIGIGLTSVFGGEPSVQRQVALQIPLFFLPLEAWGILFALVGTMAIVSSRWPPFATNWGYTALTGLSAGWAAVYTIPVLFQNSPPLNLSQGLSWGLVAFLWWAISGLVNPTAIQPKDDSHDDRTT